ncbi:MAG: YeeE/YedE family protein [Methylococcaceae bacterium]|nr:YeeE/YedE family protein [Methylococcaceae bacterium]
MNRLIIALISGFLFGLGLALSQMVNPVKITDFLDVAGNWDPSLLLVMSGALAVTLISFRLVLKRAKPFYEASFDLPTRSAIDWKLIGGASLFGIGWGLTGYCPGPATASLGMGFVEPFVMVVSILVGFFLHRLIFERPHI